jgi:hypothetical protein
MRSAWERIKETKKKFLGQMDSYRKNKLEYLKLESLRMEKEAKARKDYEEARLKLDGAKKMKRDRIMAPLKNTQSKAKSMRSSGYAGKVQKSFRVKSQDSGTKPRALFDIGKGKKDKWEPKSLL